MDENLKAVVAKLTNQPNDVVRPACKKCGYAGHLTFQCRNFVKINPNKDIMLDVSSTSSDSESDTPLIKLNEERHKPNSSEKCRKKKRKHSKEARSRVNLTSDIRDDETQERRKKHHTKKRKSRSRSPISSVDSDDDKAKKKKHKSHKKSHKKEKKRKHKHKR
ncbi:SREK1IP1 (predicted) [Pycnogonum litorale]